MIAWGRRLIHGIGAILREIGAFAEVSWRGMNPSNWRRTMRSELLRALYEVGARGVPAILVTAILVGLGLVMQIVYWTEVAGQADRAGRITVLIVVRLLGPILTALVLIGRSGSVMVDEIGRLSISGHLRLLRSQGIDPADLVILPRAWAMALACLLLSVLFTHITLWSGFIGAALFDMSQQPPTELIVDVFSSMSVSDHILVIVKPLAIGYVVGYITAWLALRVPRREDGVRRALPKAFVNSLLATFVVGLVLSTLL